MADPALVNSHRIAENRVAVEDEIRLNVTDPLRAIVPLLVPVGANDQSVSGRATIPDRIASVLYRDNCECMERPLEV
jgi:hypothetical protein